MPFALALGIVAGLLGLIPQIGATLAAVVLSLVALTQGVPQALIMLAVCIGYQQVENYVLQPTIQGRAAEISGFFVIASVIVGAALLGVVGALIAVPIVASVQIVIRELTAERRAAVAVAHAATPGPALRGDSGLCRSGLTQRRPRRGDAPDDASDSPHGATASAALAQVSLAALRTRRAARPRAAPSRSRGGPRPLRARARVASSVNGSTLPQSAQTRW